MGVYLLCNDVNKTKRQMEEVIDNATNEFVKNSHDLFRKHLKKLKGDIC